MENRNLEGVRFGKLIVLECVSDKTKITGFSNLEWRCQCDCGNIKIIKGSLLVHGYYKSCGCSQRIHRLKHIGEKIGKLTVIAREGDLWRCRCECGKEVLKPNYFFRLKHTTHIDCGNHVESKKHKNLKIDLIGQKFGDWTVVERDLTYTGHHVRYLCKNSKNETISHFSFYIQELIEKENNKNMYSTDLTGNTFGDLTVVEKFTEKRIGFKQVYNGVTYRTYYLHKKKYPQWICSCKCGNKIVLTSKDLIHDFITDCGCKSGLKKNSTRYCVCAKLKEIELPTT